MNSVMKEEYVKIIQKIRKRNNFYGTDWFPLSIIEEIMDECFKQKKKNEK